MSTFLEWINEAEEEELLELFFAMKIMFENLKIDSQLILFSTFKEILRPIS